MTAFFSRLFDLLYPRACANCARVGQAWCEFCAAELAAYPFAPVMRVLENGFQVVAFGAHEGIARNAVHALKFDGARDLAQPLGTALADGIAQMGIAADLLVPVPLHSQREAWRGYNQSALLAENVAVGLDIPAFNAVTRLRSTGTQVGRDADERRLAVAGAFAADSARVSGLRVLLIDDVVTTGATLSACAEALYAAGAADVRAACVLSA